MPGGATHVMLMSCAMKCLPPEQAGVFGREIEALCTDYCLYPDAYYGEQSAAIRPYLCFVDEVPFHYPPNEPVEYNNWRMETRHGQSRLVALPLPENLHHRHCRVAFLFYFRNLAAALAAGRTAEAAKFTGSLGHFLEDNTLFPHVLEGMDGTDIFVLDRYVRPPSDRPRDTPVSVLSGETVRIGRVEYAPRLLGTSPEEAAFHLYTRFCETVAENRYHALPLLQGIYSKNRKAERRHFQAMYEHTVQLLADTLYTATVIAGGSSKARDLVRLEAVSLANVRAARRPRLLSPPYRFTPFIVDAALNPQRRAVPLALKFDDGRRVQYRNGLGLGAHLTFAFEYQLPPKVFRRLRGAAGLHPDLGQAGHVRLTWSLDGKQRWQEEFQGTHLAAEFDVDVSRGGWLVLRGEALTPSWAAPENNLVLGEPTLERSPGAPVGP